MSDDVKFCILNVVEHFEKCLVDDDDVNMDEYLLAYTELNKFFALMGKVFGFVSSDVKEKVQILEAFRLGSEQKANFETFKSMMEHEQESALLEKKGYVSGSRTLLRLHRGMGESEYTSCRPSLSYLEIFHCYRCCLCFAQSTSQLIASLYHVRLYP